MKPYQDGESGVAYIDRLESEVGRLRAGIQAYLDGDYEPRVKTYDRCPHGQYGYEICEACIDKHFADLLATDT